MQSQFPWSATETSYMADVTVDDVKFIGGTFTGAGSSGTGGSGGSGGSSAGSGGSTAGSGGSGGN